MEETRGNDSRGVPPEVSWSAGKFGRCEADIQRQNWISRASRRCGGNSALLGSRSTNTRRERLSEGEGGDLREAHGTTPSDDSPGLSEPTFREGQDPPYSRSGLGRANQG